VSFNVIASEAIAARAHATEIDASLLLPLR